MFCFSSLSLLAAYTVGVVLAAPQTVSPSVPICPDYQWGMMIEQLTTSPLTVYNQYLITTSCDGPAWVQSSTVPDPPASVSPWGITYDCEVTEMVYECGGTPIATCCGKLA